MQKLSLLVLCLLPAAAAAQSSANDAVEEIRKNARAHVGPFYATPALQLKELGVDSNVFNEASEQKADFTFTLAPALDLWLPIARRALITTAVGSDFVYYAKYATERSINPNVKIRGDLFLHRLTLFAETGFLNTRQRANFEIDVRSRRQENSFQLGGRYSVTPKFSLEAAAARGTVAFDGDEFFLGTSLRETLNRTTTGYRLTVRHRLTPLTSVSVLVETFDDTFEFSPRRDTGNIRVLPGVEFKPRALINGNAHVGFRRLSGRGASAVPEYTGLVSKLGLSYTLLDATTFGVTVDRDVTYSFEPLQPYYLSTSAGASLRRAVGRRFDLLFSADRHHHSYRDLRDATRAAGILSAGARVDTVWEYEGSLGYRPGRTTRLGAGIWYSQRRSTARSLSNYDNLRIRAIVTSRF